MIKLIIFDMDGVLVEAKTIHYNALNIALSEISQSYIISYDEHLSKYDGLKTLQKLELLHLEKSLPKEYFDTIWNRKQQLTIELLQDLKPSQNLIDTFKYLSTNNYHIAICSNSIRKTILTILSKLNIIEYIDIIISNQDVKNSKPHPEIYWKAISEFRCLPEETLILEDSPHGLLAASRSHSHILRISHPKDITMDSIKKHINTFNINNKLSNNPPWSDNLLNIVIPMAGAGSRFQQAGYTFPKPLIDINNRPMIELVVNNININANYIFIVQKEHRNKYNLDTLLNLIAPNCKIIEIDHITDGAACTALLAKEFINNKNPLFFANSDQYIEWDSNEFMYKMNETNCDGGIVTFTSTHPKWSFVRKNELGFVAEVAEKNPISDEATVGFYYWKHGSDFVKYAEQMIKLDKRINKEFYICPVYNEAIQDDFRILTYRAKKMWGIGTPEDLNIFLKEYIEIKN
jgi:HAD superfamily hydrolase (TIGR01509 family)